MSSNHYIKFWYFWYMLFTLFQLTFIIFFLLSSCSAKVKKWNCVLLLKQITKNVSEIKPKKYIPKWKKKTSKSSALENLIFYNSVSQGNLMNTNKLTKPHETKELLEFTGSYSGKAKIFKTLICCVILQKKKGLND